ncbi:hypothetical protein EV426DRAFT_593548 [Tirmania nivea]|nr:hypothetical protein EV426DRAFT_593548 [Tirmania nivea]
MAAPCEGSRGDTEVPYSLENYFKIGNIGGPSGLFSNLGDKISSRMGKGDAPKKRGPKPDQRPAKNDKIERNRKAQRSHRERKERYIRNLEQEVQRLREAYTAAVREKVAIMEENRQLQAILKQHGVTFPYAGQIQEQAVIPVDNIPSTTQSVAQLQIDHHRHDFSQRGLDYSHHVHPNPSPSQFDFDCDRVQGTVLGGQQITPEQYSQIAINLVLGLEKPCSDHMQELVTLSHQNSDYIQGHVLMVSCPPESHTMANPDQDWGLRTVDLDPEPLGTLFNMQVLDVERQKYLQGHDGELTPMAVWTKITTHPRFHELTRRDFDTLTQALSKRVSCYGFGAVIEEAEVEDVMDALFAAKDDPA